MNSSIGSALPKGWLLVLGFALALLTGGCARLKQFAYEGFNRDSWQQPERVIAALKLHSGDTVADIGSGGGYFTFKLARAVGPDGKVYAVDIDKDMVELVRNEVKEQSGLNVTTVLGRPDDPLLPENSIDLIFTANTYHHIGDRVRYFANLQKYLRPAGRIAIVELDRRDWMARLSGHHTPADVIEREMAEAGYRLEQKLDFLDRQSFQIFTPKR